MAVIPGASCTEVYANSPWTCVESQERVHRLVGMPAQITLHNTEGDAIFFGADVSFVVYLYPGSAASDEHGHDTSLADAEQHRGFRELHDDLIAHRVVTVGVSSQPFEKQQQTIMANGLPQQLASDESLQLADLLGLPTFRLGDRRFYHRLTLIVARGVILHVCYPVTITGRNANEITDWLRSS
jgi:peroxiredoxin